MKHTAPTPNSILEDLKQMSNNYVTYNTIYVIPKSVLDIYIAYLENAIENESPLKDLKGAIKKICDEYNQNQSFLNNK